MATSHRNPSSGRSEQSSRTVLPMERNAAARLANMLVSRSTRKAHSVQVVLVNGESVELPHMLADVMFRAAELVAEGRQVTVLACEELLSTQAAAEILGVSRQYLVRLIDRREISAEKVGTHRRLRADDVEAFKTARDAKRHSALDRLTALSEDLDGYDLGGKR